MNTYQRWTRGVLICASLALSCVEAYGNAFAGYSPRDAARVGAGRRATIRYAVVPLQVNRPHSTSTAALTHPRQSPARARVSRTTATRERLPEYLRLFSTITDQEVESGRHLPYPAMNRGQTSTTFLEDVERGVSQARALQAKIAQRGHEHSGYDGRDYWIRCTQEFEGDRVDHVNAYQHYVAAAQRLSELGATSGPATRQQLQRDYARAQRALSLAAARVRRSLVD